MKSRHPRRVVLIDPPLYKHPLWDPIRTSQPLGIWSIGSYLQALGHEVRLICAPLEGLEQVDLVSPTGASSGAGVLAGRLGVLDRADLPELAQHWWGTDTYLRIGLSTESIVARIAEFEPDLVGIAAIASCSHQSVVDLSRAINRTLPDVPIIVGGQHATAMPEAVLHAAGDAVRHVVVGEGEQVTAQILDALDAPQKIEELPGVASMGDGEVRVNRRPSFLDVTALPPMDPSLIEHVPLPSVPAHTFGSSASKFTDMLFSVGCHRACPYCFSPVMRGRLRTWSWEQITEQLTLLRDHGYEEIVLQDDDLLKDRQFFVSLIRAIQAAGLSWQDNGGMELELLDEAFVDEIVDSGCTSIYIPVNPRQLADRLPTEAAVRNVHLLKRLRDGGVYTFTSGIYGVPNLEEPLRTLDDLRALREFHVDLVQRRFVDASLAFPLSTLPGTKWFREVERSSDFYFEPDDWLAYSIFVPQVYLRSVEPQALWIELLETHRRLNEVQESHPWFSAFPNRLDASSLRAEHAA